MTSVSPREAYARARPGRRVIGWLVEEAARDALLARFPPRYERTIAHHVTLRARVDARSLLPEGVTGEIVGECDDGEGVQALVVRIAGGTERPDGGTYHITWSLAEGRRPVESNAAIRRLGWRAIDPPVPVPLRPARL